MSIDTEAFKLLEKRPDRWFCFPCLTKEIGLKVPDDQPGVAIFVRSVRASKYSGSGYDVSDTETCDICKTQNGGDWPLIRKSD